VQLVELFVVILFENPTPSKGACDPIIPAAPYIEILYLKPFLKENAMQYCVE
jgi:hypothetical protein